MNQLARKETITLAPRNIEEAMKFSQLISKSAFIPKNFQGNPCDILVAIQYGMEIGLQPLQALQSIAVIGNKPTLYGDAPLALIQQHKDYEWIKEEFRTEPNGNIVAVCTIKRRNHEPHVSEFSLDDAKKGGSFNKAVWQQHTKRMLKMRARGFAIRDTFADALMGFISREEAIDYPNVQMNDAELPEVLGLDEPESVSLPNIEQISTSQVAESALAAAETKRKSKAEQLAEALA